MTYFFCRFFSCLTGHSLVVFAYTRELKLYARCAALTLLLSFLLWYHFASLDPVVSTRMEDLVRELQRVCPTCILVTHSFSTVRRTADRLVFLHDGKLRWDGSVADIDSCENPYVKQFFNASLDGPIRFKDDALIKAERGVESAADGIPVG